VLEVSDTDFLPLAQRVWGTEHHASQEAEGNGKRVHAWLNRLDVKPLFIEPGSPWENGYIESFNGKMRDELLAREILDPLKEAQVLIEKWRRQYNTIRPHSALGYRPPAPAAIFIQPAQIQPVGLT